MTRKRGTLMKCVHGLSNTLTVTRCPVGQRTVTLKPPPTDMVDHSEHSENLILNLMNFHFLNKVTSHVGAGSQAPVVQNLAMWVSILSLWVLIKFLF